MDDQRVQHADPIRRDVMHPRRVGIDIHLYLIDDRGAEDRTAFLQYEQIAARERRLRRRARGVDAASPADFNAARFLRVMDCVIHRCDAVEISCIRQTDFHTLLRLFLHRDT